MNTDTTALEGLWPLIDAALSGSATAQQADKLESLLKNDREACEVYCEYASIEAELYLLARGRNTSREICGRIDASSAVNYPSSPFRSAPAPPSLPFPGLLTVAIDGTAGYFSSGWPVAYLVATVIFGIGLTIGALVHVSEPVQLAEQPPSVTKETPTPTPRAEFVGRITGMAECKFEERSGFRVQDSGAENQKSEIRNQKSLVALGDKLALSSGLLEVTYDAGAKVILQGPVTYEVESSAGGYLSLGKLTARVEGAKSQAANQKSEIRNHKLFVVRTPTATVTDLGTEFGVETDGVQTRSYVFQGEIEVLSTAAQGDQARPVRVMKGQSLVIDRSGIAASRSLVEGRRFVRDMPARLSPYFPALAGGEVVFNETFDTDSTTPAATYPDLTFYLDPAGDSGGKAHSATVRGGVLQLDRWRGKRRSEITEAIEKRRTEIATKKTFSGSMLVSVDIGGHVEEIGTSNAALCLGDMVFLFHPGVPDGGFRVQRGDGRYIDSVGPGADPSQNPQEDSIPSQNSLMHNANLGFTPAQNVLHHLSVYYNGRETYQVCMVNGDAPHQVFRRSLQE